MKRVLAFLTCLVLACAMITPVFAANFQNSNCKLVASATQLERGDAFSVYAKLTNAETIKMATTLLKFDGNVFELTGGAILVASDGDAEPFGGVLPADKAGTFIFSNKVNPEYPGKVVSGNLFRFDMKVKKNAAKGSFIIGQETTIGVDKGNAITSTGVTVTVTCKGHNDSSNWTKKVTNPTLTKNGYTTFTCNSCGDSRVENYTFPDVRSNAWYYRAVEFSVAKGFFSGHGDGTFGPSDGITRQDFVVVLARIAKADLSKYSGKTSFTDVSSKAYYARAIHWASANRVVMGYNDTKFGVGDKITREQLVTILYRYAMQKGYNTSVTGNAMTKLNAFSDANKVSPYSKPACAWGLEKGVLSGKNATTFDPKGSATRSQVAAILMNISLKNIMPI